MGSVEMRVVRSALLAIVVALALVTGLASTANADDKTAASVYATANAIDPGDPGLPPD
jgi:hypothetical protein